MYLEWFASEMRRSSDECDAARFSSFPATLARSAVHKYARLRVARTSVMATQMGRRRNTSRRYPPRQTKVFDQYDVPPNLLAVSVQRHLFL